MIQIAPSILACDFAKLGDEVRAVAAAGADVIHVDVMDGHFVPNISIGVPIVKSLRPVTKLPLDCHLMISEPHNYIEPFAKAGADWISVHVETCDLRELLPAIQKLGCKAGAVINPPTALNQLLPFVELADYILVMSVNPGFAGQKMIPDCIDKVRTLRQYLVRKNLDIPIQIDGGITLDNVGQATQAGASIIVAGSTIFHADDYSSIIAQLRAAS